MGYGTYYADARLGMILDMIANSLRGETERIADEQERRLRQIGVEDRCDLAWREEQWHKLEHQHYGMIGWLAELARQADKPTDEER
jgi:hypothetical protein